MPADRYNLRPRSSESAPRSISTDTQDEQNTGPVSPGLHPAKGRLFLYQSPEKWTVEHLRILNLHLEENVSIDRIFDGKYIPPDSDIEFQRMTSMVQNPTVEDADQRGSTRDISDRENPFWLFFDNIRRFKWVGHLVLPDESIDLIMDILIELYPDDSLGAKTLSRIPLSIPDLKAGRGVWVDGSIVRFSEGLGEMGIPLAILSRKRENDDLGMAKYEIPQLLLQANMAFNYDEKLEQYEAFVISVKEQSYTYTFVRAVMSAEYIRSIRAGIASGKMEVSRSQPFDIVDRNQRREFLRALMGMARYFINRKEFAFPMHKYRAVG